MEQRERTSVQIDTHTHKHNERGTWAGTLGDSFVSSFKRQTDRQKKVSNKGIYIYIKYIQIPPNRLSTLFTTLLFTLLEQPRAATSLSDQSRQITKARLTRIRSHGQTPVPESRIAKNHFRVQVVTVTAPTTRTHGQDKPQRSDDTMTTASTTMADRASTRRASIRIKSNGYVTSVLSFVVMIWMSWMVVEEVSAIELAGGRFVTRTDVSDWYDQCCRPGFVVDCE